MPQRSEAPAAGLRERKKQRTRQELAEAAIRLFSERGYEHTTVDQIAAAADVSQRTFFRYFANKEEVAFGVMTQAEELFFEELRRRPPEESPLQAMRVAMQEMWRMLAEEQVAAPDPQLHICMVRLIESTPALLAEHLRRREAAEERSAAELARREGVDLESDPRPRLLTAVFSAAVRVANRTWAVCGRTDLASLSSIMEDYLDQLLPALAGRWEAGQQPEPGREPGRRAVRETDAGQEPGRASGRQGAASGTGRRQDRAGAAQHAWQSRSSRARGPADDPEPAGSRRTPSRPGQTTPAPPGPAARAAWG